MKASAAAARDAAPVSNPQIVAMGWLTYPLQFSRIHKHIANFVSRFVPVVTTERLTQIVAAGGCRFHRSRESYQFRRCVKLRLCSNLPHGIGKCPRAERMQRHARITVCERG